VVGLNADGFVLSKKKFIAACTREGKRRKTEKKKKKNKKRKKAQGKGQEALVS